MTHALSVIFFRTSELTRYAKQEESIVEFISGEE